MSHTANEAKTGARLCIDLSNTLDTASISGIQRVTLELTQALSQIATVMPLDGRSGQLVPLRRGQRRRLHRLRAGNTGRTIAQRIERRALRSSPVPRSAMRLDSEAVLLDLEASWHAPMARSELLPRLDSPTAALIHDILPITNPDWFPPASVARFRSWFEAHVAAESTFLAVSQTSADAVAETGAPRPTVIRLGPATNLLTQDSETAGVGPTSQRSGVLMIGTIEPRKGHALMLDALDLLGDRAPIIDVVGRAGWDTDELIDRLDRHPNVRWHRNLPDVDLDVLWSLAGLLLQPSLGEGFGLPVTEALQRGLAVAAADIPVLREVGRGQPTLLPHVASLWAEAIGSFCDDPSAWPAPSPLDWPAWHDGAADTLDALRTAGLWPDAASASQ